MRVLYLLFAVSILMSQLAAGFPQIGYFHCQQNKGQCFKHICPPNTKYIGSCKQLGNCCQRV
uniref:Antimicrobial-peptide n=1 Tax=Alligator sinensis TaxID=38654 RepID=A0A2H4ZLE6_ALLSI|nr:antimicrobial-peptide [Alligator sinensis]